MNDWLDEIKIWKSLSERVFQFGENLAPEEWELMKGLDQKWAGVDVFGKLVDELDSYKRVSEGLWDMVDRLSIKVMDKNDKIRILQMQIEGISLNFEELRKENRKMKEGVN